MNNNHPVEDLRPEDSARLARDDFYRVVAENAEDLVVQITPDRRFGWISPKAERVLGWRSDELIGSRLLELVHPEELSELEALGSLMESGSLQRQSIALRLRTASGSYTWLSGTAHSVHDRAGRPLGVIIGFRDDNALVKARQGLEAERARLSEAINLLMDPHVMLEAVRDEHGSVVDFIFRSANDAACRYNQLEREQHLGIRLLDLLPGHRGSELFRLYVRAIETGEPLLLEDYVYPHEIFDSDRHYDIHAAKVDDSLSFTWRDITERVELLERYELLANNASDVIVLTAKDGTISWISSSISHIAGWGPDEMIGRKAFEFIAPEDRQMLRERRARRAEEGAAIVTARLLTKEGGIRWITSTARDVDGGSDRVHRIGSWHDAQAEVEALQRLEASEERLRAMLAGASDVVFWAGPDWRLRWISPSLTHVLGWSPEELIGSIGFDLLHPEDQRVAAAGRLDLDAERSPKLELTGRFRTKAGDYVWLSGTARPIGDERGELQGVVMGLREVGELVEARERSDADSKRLQGILDTVFDPYLVMEAIRDAEGKITDLLMTGANRAACEYYGWEHDELVGHRALELNPAFADSELFAAIVTCVDSGEPLKLDNVAFRSVSSPVEGRFAVRGTPFGDGISCCWRALNSDGSDVDWTPSSAASLRGMGREPQR
jgi:PAS domain S-box-containing protein